MFCPECRAEYRPEFTQCADCGVSLVDVLPEETEDDSVKLVPVFRTTNSVLLPLVKSLLDSAGIPYLVQGEGALGLLPLGAAGSMVARSTIAAVVHVKEDDAESVKELLDELEQDHPDIGGVAPATDADETD